MQQIVYNHKFLILKPILLEKNDSEVIKEDEKGTSPRIQRMVEYYYIILEIVHICFLFCQRTLI